jgi:AraC-like DNA-binding protein
MNSNPPLDSSKRQRNPTPKRAPVWIHEAIQYMVSNFEDDIRLDDLANAIGMSKFNFCRMFQKHQGLPPLKWLRKFRTLLAGELLKRNLPWSIAEICYATGFNTSAHFSRIFRETFGVSPSDFRRQSKAAPNTKAFFQAQISSVLKPELVSELASRLTGTEAPPFRSEEIVLGKQLDVERHGRRNRGTSDGVKQSSRGAFKSHHTVRNSIGEIDMGVINK